LEFCLGYQYYGALHLKAQDFALATKIAVRCTSKPELYLGYKDCGALHLQA
jgi:hypothetical protein